jgi:hypothetical protein
VPQGVALGQVKATELAVHRRNAIAVSFAAKTQSHVCLEFLSKKFKKDITDERGYRCDFKIGSGKNVSDCPG